MCVYQLSCNYIRLTVNEIQYYTNAMFIYVKILRYIRDIIYLLTIPRIS